MKQKKEFMLQRIKREGALRELAESEGYETFVIPNNVGGRFSVLTPVGFCL